MKAALRVLVLLAGLLIGAGGGVVAAFCLPGSFTLSHLVWIKGRSGIQMTIVAWWTTTWFNRMPYESAPAHLTFNFGEARYRIDPSSGTVLQIKDIADHGGTLIGPLNAEALRMIQTESGVKEIHEGECEAFAQRLIAVCRQGESGFGFGEAARWIKKEYADDPSGYLRYEGFNAIEPPPEVHAVCATDGALHAVVELQFWRVLAALPGAACGLWLGGLVTKQWNGSATQPLTDPQA